MFDSVFRFEVSHSTPETRLLAAVMIRALNDFVEWQIGSKAIGQPGHGLSAAEWFGLSGGPRLQEQGLTFEYCCEGLGIDPEDIRSHLRREGWETLKPLKRAL